MKPIIHRLLQFITAALILTLAFPFAVLPYKLAVKAGGVIGLVVFYLWSGKRKIAVENIRLSGFMGFNDHGDPERIARESFKNLGRSIVEIIKIYYGFGKGIIERVEIRGVDRYLGAKSKNKGVLIITGHCGNWELMALTCSSRVEHGSVVARLQNNPYLNRIVEKARSRFGNRIIYKKGALKDILYELKRNKWVGILMDQAVAEDEGFLVNFLGRPAWTTKMPAILARKSGTAVLPVFMHRDGDRHIIEALPEIELSRNTDVEMAVVEDTRAFTAAIEGYIKRHPTEWLWIHRRWKRA
ncbi:MAG: lysophospholipid acyltransferase family protein [Nitrospirae bacterium]|nr:lysophospholipid acyltransferase family protein [Nitrospirota bacterium]